MNPHIPDVLRLSRRFKAPRERVFAAFRSIEGLAPWFGPEGTGVKGGDLDFRAGGRYRILMRTTGADSVLSGIYLEIVAPEKIIFTWQWQEANAPQMIVSLEFLDCGAETELQLTQSGFNTGESRDNHEQGWTGSFERLDISAAAS